MSAHDCDAAGLMAQKAGLRATYAARRSSRSDADRRAAAKLLHTRAVQCSATVIAAFVPVYGEPGSIAVLDALAARARVLLPVTTGVDDALGWAAYAGESSLVPGPFGLRQPAADDGSTLADADVVLVPAVAVGLDGTRLGHGGGFYDRALRGIANEKLVAVVHDDEVAPTLPVADHDLMMGWLCTPHRFTRLPAQ